MAEAWRLVYQWPSREPGDPATGDPGGELLYDANGEIEYNTPVTRYYWSLGSLRRKLESLAKSHPDDTEPAPGRVVSVEVAEVSKFRPWP